MRGRLGWSRVLQLALLLGLASAAARGAPSDVLVDVNPTTVERATYPRNNPPAVLMVTNSEPAGRCLTNFSCAIYVSAIFPPPGTENIPAAIGSVRVVVSQDIAMFLVEGASPAVLAHEEAHRKISEHYYASAKAIVQALAGPYVGWKFALSDKANRVAAIAAIHAIQDEMTYAYRRETGERCRFAQEQFDLITNHGLNPISSEEAMARALALEETNWAANRK
jgi:Zn-dependent protease with chaperone function